MVFSINLKKYMQKRKKFPARQASMAFSKGSAFPMKAPDVMLDTEKAKHIITMTIFHVCFLFVQGTEEKAYS